ncbi:hypothetical protein ACFE04_000001 [Oxalis oulophora]
MSKKIRFAHTLRLSKRLQLRSRPHISTLNLALHMGNILRSSDFSITSPKADTCMQVIFNRSFPLYDKINFVPNETALKIFSNKILYYEEVIRQRNPNGYRKLNSNGLITSMLTNSFFTAVANRLRYIFTVQRVSTLSKGVREMRAGLVKKLGQIKISQLRNFSSAPTYKWDDNAGHRHPSESNSFDSAGETNACRMSGAM